MSNTTSKKIFRRLKRNKRILIGFATVLLIIFLVFIVDFPGLISKIVNIGLFSIFLFCFTYTVAFTLRAYKLKLIFKGLGCFVHYGPCYFSIGVGFVINDLTPGKVGDVAKIFIVKDQEDLKLSESVAGISIERVLDIIFLFFISIIALIYLYLNNLGNMENRIILGQNIQFYLFAGTALIFIILILFILLIYKTGLILKIIRIISNKLALYLEKFLNNFKEGIKKFKYHKKEFLYILFINFLIWVFDSCIIVIFFYSLGYFLNIFVLILAVMILFFSKTFPITPGGWGISENIGAIFVFIIYPEIPYFEILSIFIIEHMFRSAYLFFYGGYSIFHYNFKLKEAEKLTLKENFNKDSIGK